MKKLSDEKRKEIESYIPQAVRIANIRTSGMPNGDAKVKEWNRIYHGALTDILAREGLRVK